MKVRLNDYFLPGSGQTVSQACHWTYLTLRSECISEHLAILCIFYHTVLCVGLFPWEGFWFRARISLWVGLRLGMGLGSGMDFGYKTGYYVLQTAGNRSMSLNLCNCKHVWNKQ